MLTKAKTTKQVAWIGFMVLNHTPTESARLAKYKGDHKRMGWENTTKPHLMAEIEQKRALASAIVENKACDILRETMRIAYAPNSPVVSTGDKLRALDLLGKNEKLWDLNTGRGETTVIVISPKPRKQVESEVADE